jgi:hypothetical protein
VGERKSGRWQVEMAIAIERMRGQNGGRVGEKTVPGDWRAGLGVLVEGGGLKAVDHPRISSLVQLLLVGNKFYLPLQNKLS